MARLPDDEGSLAPYVKDGIITISDIQAPSRPVASNVRFSAYAFNREHIKGETVETAVAVPPTKPTKRPTAYVLTFGVNSFDDPAWDLGFAANDARAMSREVASSLKATGQFDKIVAVPLVSDVRPRKGELPATRENLRTALQKLSGKGTLGGHGKGIAGILMERAKPDDVVLIHIATHGYADEGGAFYILPKDIGAGVGKGLGAKLKAASISSGDLSAWLAGIDAREIVVILDTCQSAAVTGPNFKPAPIGDRSFGQLVFNKKMRLLVSTQADAASLEFGDLKHGLMTYALVNDGLTLNRAAQDKSTTFSEWLRYGLEDVVRRQSASTQLDPAKAQVASRGTVAPTVALDDTLSAGQLPILFDFGDPSGPVLAGVPFFDRSSFSDDKKPTAELSAAMDVADPVASAAALKRFIKTQRPGALTALAWGAVVENYLAANAPPTELISATRLAIQHLALVGQRQTAYALLVAVADKLAEGQAYPEIQTEFRTTAARITGGSAAARPDR